MATGHHSPAAANGHITTYAPSRVNSVDDVDLDLRAGC